MCSRHHHAAELSTFFKRKVFDFRYSAREDNRSEFGRIRKRFLSDSRYAINLPVVFYLGRYLDVPLRFYGVLVSYAAAVGNFYSLFLRIGNVEVYLLPINLNISSLPDCSGK